MINYILTSFFVHAIFLILLGSLPKVNTFSTNQIQVNIVPSHKHVGNLVLQHTPRKPLIPGQGVNRGLKQPKINLNTYALKVKSQVDPIWYAKVVPLRTRGYRNLEINLLLFPDFRGRIVSVKIIKGSGNEEFDRLALETFQEIGSIEKPPESLVKDGIIWTFSLDQ